MQLIVVKNSFETCHRELLGPLFFGATPPGDFSSRVYSSRPDIKAVKHIHRELRMSWDVYIYIHTYVQ